MRRWIRSLGVLLLLLETYLLSVHCARHEDNECEYPEDLIDRSTEVAPGELPDWAVGGFGQHRVDIVNFRIEPDGTAFSILDGGDYSGGCAELTAAHVNGEVHLRFVDEPDTEPHVVLVRTTEGRYFARGDGVFVRDCRWAEVVPANLCGRDTGGCGGYGSAVACAWDEAIGARSCGSDQPDAGP